ncbi:MAG TPA: PAS domain S-box protein [Bacteroidota bacterium]|nr:PAS domain S-box protein [Bacteroidota bacterium]
MPRQEAVLNALFAAQDELNEGIAICDKGCVILANEALSNLSGVAREKLMSGIRIADLFAGDDESKVRKALRAVSGAGTQLFEAEMFGSTREPFDVKVAVRGIPGSSHLLVSVRDISGRKQADREIHLLAQAVASTRECFLISDMEGKILFANDALIALYGYLRDELFGKHIDELRASNDSMEPFRAMREGALNGGWHGELLDRTKEGKLIHVELWLSAIMSPRGEPVAMVAVSHDVSERDQARRIQDSVTRISAVAQSGATLVEVLRLIHGVVATLMHAESFSIALLDPALNLVSFPYALDRDQPAPSPRPLGMELTDLVLKTGSPVSAPAKRACAMAEEGVIILQGQPAVDWLGVPLMVGTSCQGAIVVQSYDENVHFAETDLDLLRFVSSQVAGVIERVRAEELLRQSEEKFRTLFERAKDAIFLLRGIQFIDFNRNAMEMFRARRTDLLNMSPLDFSPEVQPDGSASAAKGTALYRAALLGEPQDFEWQYRRTDGSLFDAEISLNRIDVGGEPLMQAIVRDVTDRKRAEDALRKYEFIANTTGDLMTLVDREYRYVAANNAYCRAQGKDRSELVGRTMSEVWGAKLFASTLKPAVDSCLLGRMVNYQATFRFPSDKFKIYDVTYSPYCQQDDGGTVTHVVVVSHDITDRRLAEQALSREELRLKANLRLSQMQDSSMMELCDVALEEATRLTRSSAGYIATLSEDCASASVIAVPQPAHFRADVHDTVMLTGQERWAESLRRRCPVLSTSGAGGEERSWPIARNPIGRSLHIPVFEGGTVVALAGVANKDEEYTDSDIHQLTLFMNSAWQILQQKRAKDQLRSSLDEKEVLLKEIHHRVKNNLQVISSLLNLQSNYVCDIQDMEIFRESQNRIRSMALIHEKLYQSGSVSRVDFPQYARSLATTLFRSYRSADSNVRLDVEFGNVSLGIDLAVPCGLIINELLSNALKHAFPNGRTGAILLGFTENNGLITLTIKDDGVGFPASVDFRNPDTLGLQLVNTLTSQIGGTLELESSGGTTIQVSFASGEEKHRGASGALAGEAPARHF